MYIEKCSESNGTILVLFLLAVFFIISQPQIIASLFANKIFLLILVNFIVGSSPIRPGIAAIVISIFFFEKLSALKLLTILILLFLNFFFIFK